MNAPTEEQEIMRNVANNEENATAKKNVWNAISDSFGHWNTIVKKEKERLNDNV